MAWIIRFIPEEVESMTINIDGKHAMDWSSSEGDIRKTVPSPWTNLSKLKGHADGHPNGKNAIMKIFWDHDEKKEMRFDDGEDFDVEK